MTTERSNSLAVLAGAITGAVAAMRRDADSMAAHAISAGRLLIEAKESLPHGEWSSWLKANCGMSARSARRYMQLAASGMKTATVAEMGIRGALEGVLRTPPPSAGETVALTNMHGGAAFAWANADGDCHVLVFPPGIEHATATKRPVAPEGFHAVLSHGGFSLAGVTSSLVPGERDWCENLRVEVMAGAA